MRSLACIQGEWKICSMLYDHLLISIRSMKGIFQSLGHGSNIPLALPDLLASLVSVNCRLAIMWVFKMENIMYRHAECLKFCSPLKS